MLGLSSSYGTSTVSLTLVGSRVSTALFTSMFSNWLGPCTGDSGDGDALGAWRSGVQHKRITGAPTRPSMVRHGGWRPPRPAGARRSRQVPADRADLRVGTAGFEPATFRSQSGRATKLRHVP